MATALTLAAGFAWSPAPVQAAGAAQADASYYSVDKDDDDALVTVEKNESVTTTFEINDASGDATGQALKKVYIWAEDENGTPSSALTVTGAEKGTIANTWYFDQVTDGKQVKVQFARSGTYVICAGCDATSGGAKKIGDLTRLSSGDLNPQPKHDNTGGSSAKDPDQPKADANGAVGEDISLVMQLRDGAGRTMAPGKGSKAFGMVVSSSNPEAKVSVEVDRDSDLDNKGEVTLMVTSDADTTAVVRAVITSGRGRIYNVEKTVVIGTGSKGSSSKDDNGGTVTPEPEPEPDPEPQPEPEPEPDPEPQPQTSRTVMTIGSPDMVVAGDQIVTMDVSPFIADNRTYVPIRALAEGFGAKVDWNEADRTVTITDGDKTVVMTVGQTVYTVDGKDQSMDVAPLIDQSRTFVPVRFAAQALGYTVTPSYSDKGLTESVAFEK